MVSKIKKDNNNTDKRANPGEEKDSRETTKRARKLSEYGKQLNEKQKMKEAYGMREKQFRRFFAIALKKRAGSPGENLLSLLERRLDNTLYRLKFATTRAQARQVIVHGHVLVNGKKVSSPSFLVSVNDEVSLAQNVAAKTQFVEQVIEKRMKIAAKVPEWLELDKKNHKGRVLRDPVRSDIQMNVEEHLVVELYSK